ncbi:MAG: hypothetical protein ABIR66_01285 [Saprospiraceae bacterium]
MINKSIGYTQFEIQLAKVEKLLAESLKDKKPGLWLYQHDLRTPLFMLEGLSRIYGNIKPSKKMKKLNERFKSLEDSVGVLDYYASFEKEFSENKNVGLKVNVFLQSKADQSLQTLNTILKDGNWLNGIRINKIRKSLKSYPWIENEKKEMIALKQSYQKEIKAIKSFASKTKFSFKNVEADLHEMRRRVRWLSIYPQALGGAIKLREMNSVKVVLKKYITPEVMNSPYNLLPEMPLLKEHILLDKNVFLSLSWIISALGKLKDQGLRIHLLEEAFKKIRSGTLGKKDKVLTVLGINYPTIQTILAKASEICKIYFNEKNMDALVV